MDNPSNAIDTTDILDILGQQGSLSIYTEICLCFTVADQSLHSGIIRRLTAGLEYLAIELPWVTGQVVNTGATEDSTGMFSIAPVDKVSLLVVKDLQDDSSVPTMTKLQEARFPFRLLDENMIAPRPTLPGPEDDATKPVFLVQATFIKDGLILTFVGQHQTMDMTGQGHIMNLLSKACHDIEFTPEEVSIGNMSRRNLIPVYEDPYELGQELDNQIVKPTQQIQENTDPATPPKCSWINFAFSFTSLDALKSHAMETLDSGFISTDDALTAFIWQSIMRARLPRLDHEIKASLARAIDVRRYLDIPATYPGILQNMTYHSFTLSELIHAPLGVIASNLRAALDPADIKHRTRSLATYLHHSPNKDVIDFTASLNTDVDIMLSSWVKTDCWGLDFGLGLGMPEAVRRPQFTPVESLVYLLPKALDGEIVVAMCLRGEDMERLKSDVEFSKFGTCIE